MKYNLDGITVVSKAMEKGVVRQDNWDIFDLPQETKGIDWVGVVLILTVITFVSIITY